MKLICLRESLRTACAMASQAAANRDIKPILRNAMLTAKAGECTMQATDLEVGMIARLPDSVKVERDGRSLWPISRLSRIVAESDDETLTLESTRDECTVTGTAANFELPAEDADGFPAVDVKNVPHHTVKACDLRLAIDRTIFAAADSEHSRFGATTGVKFDFSGEFLAMVATDGRRLARIVVPATLTGKDVKANDRQIVPQRALAMLRRAVNGIDDAELVSIGFSANDVCFSLASCSIYSRLVEGRFPNWKQVLPTKFNHEASIKAGDMARAIRQAAIMTDAETVRVQFRFESNKLALKSRAASTGKCRVETVCDYGGAAVEVAFDPKFVTEMLKSMSDDTEVVVKILDAKSPVLFAVGDDYLYLAVPLVGSAAAEPAKKDGE